MPRVPSGISSSATACSIFGDQPDVGIGDVEDAAAILAGDGDRIAGGANGDRAAAGRTAQRLGRGRGAAARRVPSSAGHRPASASPRSRAARAARARPGSRSGRRRRSTARLRAGGWRNVRCGERKSTLKIVQPAGALNGNSPSAAMQVASRASETIKVSSSICASVPTATSSPAISARTASARISPIGRSRKQHELSHRLAQPGVGAVVEQQQPFVPRSVGPAPAHPADHFEALAVERPAHADRDRADVERQHRGLADRLDLAAAADDDRPAIVAHPRRQRRRAKGNLRTAIGAGDLQHREISGSGRAVRPSWCRILPG